MNNIQPFGTRANNLMVGAYLAAAALVLLLAILAPTYTSTQPGHMEFCKTATEPEIASLFERWNHSLATLDAHKVVDNYAPHSILLPTVSNKPRVTEAEKLDYFEHFLENKPQGKIDSRMIQIGCNTAFDAGLYTFTFGTTGAQVHARYTYTYAWDGHDWLITSHHSSGMPEAS